MEKLARPVQPLTDLLKRPRGGNSPRAARRLSVLHLEHLCRHRLPLHIFRPLDSPRYPAFPAKLAGEEGFEPPHPVLETGGLPLNLLPFTLRSPQATEGFTRLQPPGLPSFLGPDSCFSAATSAHQFQFLLPAP